MARELIWASASLASLAAAAWRSAVSAEAALRYSADGLFEIGAKCLEDFVAVFDLRELAGHVFAKCDDLGDGLAVFALEAVEEGQAVFDLGEALGRGVDALGVVAEGGGDVGDGGAGGGELLGGFSEARVVAGQLLDVADGGAESGLGAGSAFVELVEGAHGGGVEFFGVGQDALFGFEGFVFAGLEMGCSISLR